MLSALPVALLRRLRFPLAELTKPEVREIASQAGLAVAEKAESQDLCFLADNDYRRFLREHAGGAIRPGPILRSDGQVVGQHTGLPVNGSSFCASARSCRGRVTESSSRRSPALRSNDGR